MKKMKNWNEIWFKLFGPYPPGTVVRMKKKYWNKFPVIIIHYQLPPLQIPISKFIGKIERIDHLTFPSIKERCYGVRWWSDQGKRGKNETLFIWLESFIEATEYRNRKKTK